MKDRRDVVRFLLASMSVLLMAVVEEEEEEEVVLLLDDNSDENGEAEGSYPMGQFWY